MQYLWQDFFIVFIPPSDIYIYMSIWNQLGQDIDGEVAGDFSGESVSINSDGTIVAIGATRNEGVNGLFSGHTRVYEWDGSSSWNQLGQDIDGEDVADLSGYSVSINSDGTIVAIGALFNDGNGNDSGHTRVYKWDGSSWNQRGSDIDGEAADDRSGYSVSINSDGTIVAIGANANDGNGITSGHTRVYKWDGSSWNQLGSDIDGEAASDQSGNSVSINSDGTIVAIGAFLNDGNGTSSGHTRVYKYNGSDWVQRGSDIDGEASNDQSGYSVSINSDGTIVAIGAIENDGNGNNSGHTRVYDWDGSSWNKLGSDIDGEAAGDQSGYSVSINSDGTIVAIGANFNDGNGANSGHTRVYKWDGSSWNQLGSDIDGEAADDQSGNSVSINSDGTIVAIGAFRNDGNGTDSGHTRVYSLQEPTTTLPATTLPATTLPATTLPPTTLPATTLPATTLPATTLPATTLPATTSTTLPQEPTNTSPVKWVMIEGSMYGNRRF
jgi:hypothetical protein